MIKMDILTINDIPIVLKQFIEQYGDHNYIMSYRNRNPIRYLYSLTKLVKKNNMMLSMSTGIVIQCL